MGTHKHDHGGGDLDGRCEAGVQEGHEYHLPRRNDLIFSVQLCVSKSYCDVIFILTLIYEVMFPDISLFASAEAHFIFK